MSSATRSLINALRVLDSEIQSEDGVANAVVAEAATRLEEQQERINRLESVLSDPQALWTNWLRGTVALPAGIGDVRQYQEHIKRLEETGARAVLKAHLPDRLAAWEEANPGRVFDWNQIKKEEKP